jgi:hypothetical protein
VRPEELLAAALRGEAAPWPLDAGVSFENDVLATAREHGVAVLLASAPAAREWPGAIESGLRSIRRDAAALEVIRRQDLVRLLTAFGEAGVRCLPIKGAQLAYTHYAQPWLRQRFDTDLLVAPADRERADAILRALDYAPSNQVSGTLVAHQIQYERQDRHGLTDTVDLHWKVTNPHLFAEALTFDELWTAAEVISELGDHARALSPVHALLLACVHRVAHHHNSEKLIWLYDIHVLVSVMAPAQREEFLDLARAKRLRSICASGLDSAQRRFATQHPAGWLDRLKTGSDEPIEPTAVFLQHGVRRIDVLMSDLRAVGGWTRKMRLIREHLFPPAAYVRARYGRHTPLVFAYVGRVLTGVGKWFREPS